MALDRFGKHIVSISLFLCFHISFITNRHKGTTPRKLTAAKLQECRDNADAEDQLDPGEARSSGPRNRVGLKKSSFQRYQTWVA